jgi:hypothetical protein
MLTWLRAAAAAKLWLLLHANALPATANRCCCLGPVQLRGAAVKGCAARRKPCCICDVVHVVACMFADSVCKLLLSQHLHK